MGSHLGTACSLKPFARRSHLRAPPHAGSFEAKAHEPVAGFPRSPDGLLGLHHPMACPQDSLPAEPRCVASRCRPTYFSRATIFPLILRFRGRLRPNGKPRFANVVRPSGSLMSSASSPTPAQETWAGPSSRLSEASSRGAALLHDPRFAHSVNPPV